WHIYPQDEEVHITKLNAFLDLYTDQTAPALKTALHQSWLAWNQGGDMGEAW
ncbi:MAG TPA: elongation factor P maturation arginine rhamnosyltransferase EarP, partial [Cellvibrio sp.]|nr:elongation factor P maturation arginine rhamnosyltransferase EarP [Cellvibrio sp.]